VSYFDPDVFLRTNSLSHPAFDKCLSVCDTVRSQAAENPMQPGNECLFWALLVYHTVGGKKV